MLKLYRIKINDDKENLLLDTMFIGEKEHYSHRSNDVNILRKLLNDNKINSDTKYFVMVIEDVESEYMREHGIWLF